MNRIKNWGNKPGNRAFFLNIAGFLIMILNLWISQAFNLPASSPVNTIFIVIIFTIWGFSGLVMAKEKIYPGFENSRWVFPVFTGVVIMLISWGFALYALWRMISVLLHLSTL